MPFCQPLYIQTISLLIHRLHVKGLCLMVPEKMRLANLYRTYVLQLVWFKKKNCNLYILFQDIGNVLSLIFTFLVSFFPLVKDNDYQTSLVVLCAGWSGFSDPHTDIITYRIGVGTNPKFPDIKHYRHIGLRQGGL